MLLVKNPFVEIVIWAFLEKDILDAVSHYSFYGTVKVLPVSSV